MGLVSAIHQHESAIGIHVSPPTCTPIPPLWVVPEPLSSLSHTASSHWLSRSPVVMNTSPCSSPDRPSPPSPSLFHLPRAQLWLDTPTHCPIPTVCLGPTLRNSQYGTLPKPFLILLKLLCFPYFVPIFSPLSLVQRFLMVTCLSIGFKVED